MAVTVDSEGGASGDSDGGESGPELYEDEDEREESCSRAISSRRRSASGIHDTLAPSFADESGPVTTVDVERDGLGIDLEMSRPNGFFREMDLMAPNGEAGPEAERDDEGVLIELRPLEFELSVLSVGRARAKG